MSPIEPRTIEPLKTRMSSGSDTSGEKLSLARSFQNASLRRGSRPNVENDSRCAMSLLPRLHTGAPHCCAAQPTIVVKLVIRNNQLHEPILFVYTCYMPNRECSQAL